MEKYSYYIYLTRNVYPEHIKSSYKSIIKRQTTQFLNVWKTWTNPAHNSQAHLPLQSEEQPSKSLCSVWLWFATAPRQTQASGNTVLIFRTPKGPHASVLDSLSPWNVTPAYQQRILFLPFETSLSCHLLHEGFSDLSPSYKCPLFHIPKILTAYL